MKGLLSTGPTSSSFLTKSIFPLTLFSILISYSQKIIKFIRNFVKKIFILSGQLSARMVFKLLKNNIGT